MLAFNGISGDYAEFGCHGGTTFAMAHRNAKIRGGARHQWAFDSFSGLPPAVDGADAHPIWVAGEMATSLQDFRAACRRQGIASPTPTPPAIAQSSCGIRAGTGRSAVSR